MTRRLAAALLACASLVPVAARAEVSARDDRGASQTLAAPPQRIVSLLPSLTESVCALGACERLVGTDKFSNWPAPVRALPKLGGLEDAQIERIAALHPDLVLVSSSARIVDRLEALGLRVLVLDSNSHADVRRSLVAIAQLLGTPEAADRVWAAIDRQLQGARDRVPGALRGRSVYFEVDPTPYAAGAGSFIGETLSGLGLANALPTELGPFPKLNPEYVLRLQPDLVMATRAALDEMRRRPGWSALRALSDGRACGFAGARYEVLVRPGPRLGEAANVIVDCLVEIAARGTALAPR